MTSSLCQESVLWHEDCVCSTLHGKFKFMDFHRLPFLCTTVRFHSELAKNNYSKSLFYRCMARAFQICLWSCFTAPYWCVHRRVAGTYVAGDYGGSVSDAVSVTVGDVRLAVWLW